MQLLYAAKKQFGLVILDYIVTSDHIHLLVYDDAGREVIPKSIQLTAGRTGQEYNRRKEKSAVALSGRIDITLQRLKPETICRGALFTSI